MTPMRTLDPTALGIGGTYRLMTDVIVPRPIAWVSTVSASGAGNLAPFSYFNAVATEPAALMISITPQRDGSDKDTLRNILETHQFVVNLATAPLIQAVHQTSAEYPYGVDEMEKVGLTPIPSVRVRPARVGESPVQMECELLQTVEVGPRGAPGSTALVLGKILLVHVRETLFEGHRIRPDLLEPLARLGGPDYATLGQILPLERAKT